MRDVERCYRSLQVASRHLHEAGIRRPEVRVSVAEWRDLRLAVEAIDGSTASNYPEPIDPNDPHAKVFAFNGMRIVADGSS